ncbi:three-Cys-motif partner protein TcmP [Roseateles asaccharophilus]|uniref:three-Cys-motif partner protein TcmP n=1 Tax=Roseateles asaccharophilus TaxID=582607 RepID=UPI00286B471C|nr:three-Cys-motif partner protein TcmP [Roseateles asaccharophilus]
MKHAVLRDYLVDYFLTLVARPEQDQIKITIVDGFCGGGLYLNEDGKEVVGSPVVILEAIKEAKVRVMGATNRRKDIHFDVQLLCVDANKSALQHLRQVLTDRGYADQLARSEIELVEGEFANHAPALVQRARKRSPKSGRALFILDQYGYDQVPLQTLQAIFSTMKRPEVILTFYVDSLINYLSPDNWKAFERKTGVVGAITAADLDKATRGPGWRRKIQSALYEQITTKSGASFFTPFFVRPQKGHGDYWLLHLSHHWKARDVMAQTHWTHHNHFVQYAGPGLDMFSTGYATKIDDDGRPQAAFEFDDLASQSSKTALLEQIPRAIAACPDGVPFRKFIVDQINWTPATESMIEEAILDVVHDQQIEVIGDNGSVRHVRTAIQDDHVLRFRRQFSLGLLSKMTAVE